MRAMILAAGRGQRMGHLTEHIPKPLLRVGDRYLIEYAIESLLIIGIQDIVINVAYLGNQIQSALGDGSRYGVRFHYSVEDQALETGGGIFNALPLLGSAPFIVLSCDVVTDYPLKNLALGANDLAHLVFVNNPDFHPQGDFALYERQVMKIGDPMLTFANIGLYHPQLFANCQPGKYRLGDLLKQAVAAGRVTGEHYQGVWHNVGTPQQLQAVSEDHRMLEFGLTK